MQGNFWERNLNNYLIISFNYFKILHIEIMTLTCQQEWIVEKPFALNKGLSSTGSEAEYSQNYIDVYFNSASSHSFFSAQFAFIDRSFI